MQVRGVLTSFTRAGSSQSCMRRFGPTALSLQPLTLQQITRTAGVAQSRELNSRSVVPELGITIDRYTTAEAYLRAWRRWCASTLAVVTLRKVLPSFTVPLFKVEAARLFGEVGAALAAADERKLRQITTPSCLQAMRASLRARPRGQRHSYRPRQIEAYIKQVRIGHNASNREMKFAQVTAHIRGQLVWEITNAKGEIVGGVGSEEDPFTVDDYWVFERYLADDGAWRLKERLETKAEASALGDRGARAAA